jgi:E3 ubiquitin-protein ligase HERC1
MDRLLNGRDILYDSNGDKTPTPSETSEETDDISQHDREEEPQKDHLYLDKTTDAGDVERLCKEVWPVLAVIGGVDRGLRVGSKCTHKSTGKRAIVLGTLKAGLTSVKVQWEDAECSVR